MVLYHAGDMAGAIMQQHKELIINERCLGLDHPDTAHRHGCHLFFFHRLRQFINFECVELSELSIVIKPVHYFDSYLWYLKHLISMFLLSNSVI